MAQVTDRVGCFRRYYRVLFRLCRDIPGCHLRGKIMRPDSEREGGGSEAISKPERKRWISPQIIISEAKSTETGPFVGPEAEFPATSGSPS